MDRKRYDSIGHILQKWGGRTLAVALCACMIGTTLPLTAYADEPENTENTENEAGDSPDTTACAFAVTGGTEGTDYTYADGVLTIQKATPLTIANKDPETATSDCIFIEAGMSADITLAGVNIASASRAPFEIADNSTGNVTITLADNSKNSLKNTNYSNSGGAPLQKNGMYSERLGKLLIRCEHSDREYNTTGEHECTDACGELTATAKDSPYLAGIGGAHNQSAANIYITGGNITAEGGGGAGIGSGYIGSGNASHIYISGGVIDASSDRGGAGIGGGSYTSASDIYVSGGRVTASAKGGAGIGAGQEHSATGIYISGGIIRARSEWDGAGIGSGGRSSKKMALTSIFPVA